MVMISAFRLYFPRPVRPASPRLRTRFPTLFFAHPSASRLLALGLILATFSSMMPRAVAASKRVSNGQIIQINGDVQLKRSYGSVTRPKVGTRIYPQDKLMAANGAQVVVQCADLSSLSVEGAGEHRLDGCASVTKKAQCTPGTYKCPSRPGSIALNNSSIPYIISPRRTNLLNPQPKLRWNPVPGATSYTVSIKGEGVDWKTKVSDTQIVYPGEQPLQPGGYYLLIVRADTGASSTDEPIIPGGLGFSLLEATSAQQVRSQAAEIAQQPWTKQAKTLALVNLYLKYGLTFEAVEMLEDLVNGGVETAPIYNKVGELYLNFLALAPQAKTYYAQAVKLADSNDIEEQTVAQEGLGQVQARFGNQDEAIRLLTMARDGYEALGDTERVSQLEKQLRALISKGK
ncbi:MAG: tetratricopeptide repeat protein [Symploca sp. SIO2G7]|nr:tetratricopeptide repeat protein [Symploca sp. SIO2G7]